MNKTILNNNELWTKLSELAANWPKSVRNNPQELKKFNDWAISNVEVITGNISKKTVKETTHNDIGQTITTYKDIEIKEIIPLGNYLNRKTRGDIFDYFVSHLDFSNVNIAIPWNRKPNQVKFISTLRKLMPNVNGYKVGYIANIMTKLIENIYYNLGDTSAHGFENTFGIMLYLYSQKGGCGKTYLLKNILRYLETINIPCGYGHIKGRFVGGEFNSQILTCVNDYIPSTRDSEFTIENINNIVDNSLYKVEGKGSNSYFIKSNTTLLVTSNYIPHDKNDRRYAIIPFNEGLINTKSPFFHKYTNEEYNELFRDLFESVDFNAEYQEELFVKNIKPKATEVINMVRDLIEEYQNKGVDIDHLEDITPSKFAALYCKVRLGTNDLNTINGVKISVQNQISEFNNFRIKKIRGEDRYSRYNFVNISKVPTMEDDIDSCVLDDIDDDLERTYTAWTKLLETLNDDPINPPESPNPDDDPTDDTKDELIKQLQEQIKLLQQQIEIISDKNTKEFINEVQYASIKSNTDKDTISTITDETKEDVIKKVCRRKRATTYKKVEGPTKEDLKQMGILTFKDIYDKEPHINVNDQFWINSVLKPEYIQELTTTDKEFSRSKDNMTPTMLVYESDNFPVEQQLDKAMSLLNTEFKKHIVSITHSGSKSIHVCVKLPTKDEQGHILYDNNKYKYIWKEFAKLMFGEDYLQYLDEACATIGRLNRLPNGTRDNGKEQTCYYFNKDANPIEIDEIVREYNFEIMSRLMSEQQYQYQTSNDTQDEETKLTNYYNKNKEWSDIYDTLICGFVPASGSNMIGNLGKLWKAGFRELHKRYWDICHKHHPSNIGNNYLKYCN